MQAALGIGDCVAFDVPAVCSGFLYALSVAESMIRGGTADTALVIGAETFSRILDWEDRATCVLFGDGAGAVVLQAEESASDGAASCRSALHADGRHNQLLYVDGGPSTTGTVGKLRMKGQEVFRHAVTNLAAVMGEALAQGRARRRRTSTGWCRTRPIAASSMRPRSKLGLAPDKVIVTVDQHANTSAASVPLAFDTAVRDGRIKPGDLIVFEAMGGGFTWGAAVVRLVDQRAGTVFARGVAIMSASGRLRGSGGWRERAR